MLSMVSESMRLITFLISCNVPPTFSLLSLGFRERDQYYCRGCVQYFKYCRKYLFSFVNCWIMSYCYRMSPSQSNVIWQYFLGDSTFIISLESLCPLCMIFQQSDCFSKITRPMRIKMIVQRVFGTTRNILPHGIKNQAIVNPGQNYLTTGTPKFSFTSCSTPSQVPLLEEVEAVVMQIIKLYKPSLFANELLDAGKFGLDRNAKFEKLGFDSLDVTEMIVTLEDRLSIQLEDEQALSIDSIASASQIFFIKMNSRIMNKLVTSNTHAVLK